MSPAMGTKIFFGRDGAGLAQNRKAAKADGVPVFRRRKGDGRWVGSDSTARLRCPQPFRAQPGPQPFGFPNLDDPELHERAGGRRSRVMQNCSLTLIGSEAGKFGFATLWMSGDER